MIKAVIYDMDGVIVDSEPLWREVEIRIFNDYGATLTEDMCRESMGLRIDESMEYLTHKFATEFPPNMDELVVSGMIKLIKEKGVMMDGVMESLDFFTHQGMKIALASSSHMVLIDAVIDSFGIRKYFEVVHSAEYEQYGKPHPGVYMTTAGKLGVLPKQCLVIEDSINGVISAKAAKMKCLAVPDSENTNSEKFAMADFKLDSLSEIESISIL